MFLLKLLPGSDVLPPDGGILYTETNLQRLVPEPLNTITAAFFLIISVYWLIRLKGFSAHSLFLSVATYILLLGSIGGIAYHGLRQYKLFIMMDWVPIVVLCLMASVYFWTKIINRRVYVAIPVIVFFLIQFVIRLYMEGDSNLDWAINLNYGIMALMVISPLLIYTFRTGFNSASLVYTAIACFAGALFFRISDGAQVISVGTHFLWHTLGAIATHLMFLYICRMDARRQVTVLSES